MKTVKKALLLVLCAVLMVGASVFGTLAYLTDQEAVTNTFSVGSVGLSLDEAKVTPDGVPVTGADRVHDNEYHLLPGMSYTKDPVIHVDLNSEDSYIFVKVENAIADYEAATENTTNGYKSIADQIADNGWTPLDGVENVYYKTYTKGQNDKDLEVFANFKIDGMANTVLGWDAITPETTKVNVTGYAVQKAGFGTALEAWNATFASEAGGGTGEGGAGSGTEITDQNIIRRFGEYATGNGWSGSKNYNFAGYENKFFAIGLKTGDVVTVQFSAPTDFEFRIAGASDDDNITGTATAGNLFQTLTVQNDGLYLFGTKNDVTVKVWVKSAG